MTAVGYSVLFDEVGSPSGRANLPSEVRQIRSVLIETADTVDAADTIAITLANYGITTFWGLRGWKHTTNGSVVVTENPIVTVVSAGVLTVTVPAGTDNDARFYEIWGV